MTEKHDIVNDNEIRFFGQRRSGHHAIMNWVYAHFSGPSGYVNEISKIDQIDINSHFKNATIEEIELDRKGTSFFKKECLILNVEDADLKLASEEIEKSKFYPRGRSKKITNILILRDPFNLFASRLKKSMNDGTSEVHWIGENSVRTWIQHAKEFLNETNYLGDNLVTISYNHWFSDIDYRRQISEKLDLKFTDDGFLTVPSHGGGSSFDGVSKNQNANTMEVLQRWRVFEGDERLKTIFENNVILNLSKAIFGDILN